MAEGKAAKGITSLAALTLILRLFGLSGDPLRLRRVFFLLSREQIALKGAHQ